MSALALTNNQFRLAIRDLIDTRLAPLHRLGHGGLFEAALRSLGVELDAAEARGEVETDTEVLRLATAHREAALPIHHLVEAQARDPLASPEQRKAATRLRKKLVDGMRGASIPARERFEHAEGLQERRASLDADLAQFPAAPGAPSLAQRVDAWIRIGLDIGKAISARTAPADAAPRRTPKELRASARTLFSDLRSAIHVARRHDAALPENLEAQILGFLDALVPEPRRKPATKPTAKAAAQPATEPTAEDPAEDPAAED